MKKVNTYCQFQLIRNKEVKEYWNEEKYITDKSSRSMYNIHKRKLQYCQSSDQEGRQIQIFRVLFLIFFSLLHLISKTFP